MNLPKINIDAILKLPLSKRLGVLAGVNIVIVALFYWFVIGPKHDEIKKLRTEMDALESKLVESRAIAADFPKFIREKEEMEARLKNAIAQLPNDKEIPNLLDSISSSGEKSGLRIVMFKPGPEVKKGFYAEVPVNMTVEGQFESLNAFSVKVGNLPRIVNIGGMNIVSAGHRNRVPILNADFVATTFRFIPAQTVADAKGDGKPKGEPGAKTSGEGAAKPNAK